jgi:glycosyltransferase involved in cell wall biosynthesis
MAAKKQSELVISQVQASVEKHQSPFMKSLAIKADGLPRLCFVGPMVGNNPGHVTTQGEIVSAHFGNLGYPVIKASSYPNRYARLADIVWTIIRRRKEIDLLVVHVYSGPSFVVEDIASALGKLFGHRIIMFLHGGAMPEFMARFPNWTRRVFGRAQMIIAPSAYLSKAVEPHGFAAQIIPNIIDLSQYPYRHRRRLSPRLFWMRSFHEVWNPLMAVRVLARLRQKVSDATLVLAGQDKGLQVEAQRLAESLGVLEAIRFPGFLNLEGKIREGSQADIFINTNRIDNMPVAVVEACAMGLPVVTTNVGGIPDLLTERQTGLLVPDDDDEKMAEAVYSLLENPDLASRLSTNGRKLAEQSSWNQVRLQWEAMFEQLLTRH